MASKGYPGAYQKGTVISEIARAEDKGCMVFHAGTATNSTGEIVASGGRVLGVTAVGDTAEQARNTAYAGVAVINWPEGFYRNDIAKFATKNP